MPTVTATESANWLYVYRYQFSFKCLPSGLIYGEVLGMPGVTVNARRSFFWARSWMWAKRGLRAKCNWNKQIYQRTYLAQASCFLWRKLNIAIRLWGCKKCSKYLKIAIHFYSTNSTLIAI